MVNVPPGSRDFRSALGFSSQGSAREFLGAKDIVPTIDFGYIHDLTMRLAAIIRTVNGAIHESCRPLDLEKFVDAHVIAVLEAFRRTGRIPKLNNQGRRPEEVYFSWTRGYALGHLFTYSLAQILGLSQVEIRSIGDDDIFSQDEFHRSAKADFEVEVGSEVRRFEVQTGFTGINDIKRHKVQEGLGVFRESGVRSYAFHIDIFNGQAALIPLFDIRESDRRWELRAQMEGQAVFAIDQASFRWKISEPPPSFLELIGEPH
jgi:hypothetical protein